MEEMNAEIEEEIKVMRAEREEAEAKKKARKPRAPRKKKVTVSVSIVTSPVHFVFTHVNFQNTSTAGHSDEVNASSEKSSEQEMAEEVQLGV